MKGIILAAGRGSRMAALTEDQPKCLVQIQGQTLLSLQIGALRAAGIERIAIVTGYKREMLAGKADAEFFNPRWNETNMVSSLCEASEWLESGPCVVSYSDIFYEPAAVASLMESDAPLAITYDPGWEALWTERFGNPLVDAETFKMAGDGRLIEIGRKPMSLAEIEGQYMGLLRFAPEGWAELQAMRQALSSRERDSLDMTSALQRIIERGRVPVRAIAYRGAWGEVDSSADLRLFNRAERAPG